MRHLPVYLILLVGLLCAACSADFESPPEIPPGTEMDFSAYQGYWRAIGADSSGASLFEMDGTPFPALQPGQQIGAYGSLGEAELAITDMGSGRAAVWPGMDFQTAALDAVGTVINGYQVVAVEQAPELPWTLWTVHLNDQGHMILQDLNLARIKTDVEMSTLAGTIRYSDAGPSEVKQVLVTEGPAQLRDYLQTGPSSVFSSTIQVRFERLPPPTEQAAQAAATSAPGTATGGPVDPKVLLAGFGLLVSALLVQAAHSAWRRR